MKEFKRVILTTIVGLLISLGIVFVNHTGISRQWIRLQPPPAQVTKLVLFDGFAFFGNFYIETVDNKIYTYFCSGQGGKQSCWEEAKRPDQTSASCDFSLPAFAFTTRPPQNIVQCLQRVTSPPDIDSTWVTAYALDKTGDIWVWDFSYHINWASLADDVLLIGEITFVAFFIGLIWEVFSQPSLDPESNKTDDHQ
jgi:hypothetical protein